MREWSAERVHPHGQCPWVHWGHWTALHVDEPGGGGMSQTQQDNAERCHVCEAPRIRLRGRKQMLVPGLGWEGGVECRPPQWFLQWVPQQQPLALREGPRSGPAQTAAQTTSPPGAAHPAQAQSHCSAQPFTRLLPPSRLFPPPSIQQQVLSPTTRPMLMEGAHPAHRGAVSRSEMWFRGPTARTPWESATITISGPPRGDAHSGGLGVPGNRAS